MADERHGLSLDGSDAAERIATKAPGSDRACLARVAVSEKPFLHAVLAGRSWGEHQRAVGTAQGQRLAVGLDKDVRLRDSEGEDEAKQDEDESEGAKLGPPKAEPEAAENNHGEPIARHGRKHGDGAGQSGDPFSGRNHEIDADAHGLQGPCFEPERHGGERKERHGHDEERDKRCRDQVREQTEMRDAVEVIKREGRNREACDNRRERRAPKEEPAHPKRAPEQAHV